MMQSWSRHNSAVFLAMVIPPVLLSLLPRHGIASVVSVDVMWEWHQVQALLISLEDFKIQVLSGLNFANYKFLHFTHFSLCNLSA